MAKLHAMQPIDILVKYWGHTSFREPQEEIIQTILDKSDALAIMPTGGGKSICFQIPALLMDGICIVISPLVALMQDQVENLNVRGIKAMALTGGKSVDETSDLLDNCRFGNYKFLYISPERLQSDWILERIKALPVNLIAVDEAHCISQWGHDFRPAYTKISILKDHLPKIPVLALTASATKPVEADILNNLKIPSAKVFRKSFKRANLAYLVYEIEDKLYQISRILNKNKQSSIIYVRNRKSCIDVSAQLEALGFTSTYYHGGLSARDKDKNMKLWMENQRQVIVATNAFGMGIDKPDVKTVIHIQLPENLENYYQEAGRAGRNGERAFAILFLSPSDVSSAENQFLSVLPDKKFLTQVFVKLCNYFGIAYGEGIDETFAFNLNRFCLQYNFPAAKTFNALQFLDRQGIILLSQEFSEKLMVQFIIESKELIRYMSINNDDEEMLLAIVRTYSGIYEHKIAINLQLMAKKSGRKEDEIRTMLDRLFKLGIINLEAFGNDSILVFNEVREDDRTINRIAKYLEDQNKLKASQLKSVISYASNNGSCKQNIILNYFGELAVENCGICSYCLKKVASVAEVQSLQGQILELLKDNDLTSRQIQELTNSQQNDVIFAIRQLLDSEEIFLTNHNLYSINEK